MRIRPLTLAAVGIVLVVIDLRFPAGDTLPDAIGWALVAFAAYRLGMRWPLLLASAATLAALAEVHLPYECEAYDLISGDVIPNPDPNSAYDERLVFLPVEGPRLAMVVGSVALGGAALTMMLRQLRHRAETTTDRRGTEALKILSWVVPLGWIGPYVAIAIGWTINQDGFDPVWNDQWELVALVGIAIAIAVAVVFAHELQPPVERVR